jgi:plasmid stability protein
MPEAMHGIRLGLHDAASDFARAACLPIERSTDILISIAFRGQVQRPLSMAQFIVRQLEETVKAALKRRAERHGRSMEEEVREVLRNAAKEENRPVTSRIDLDHEHRLVRSATGVGGS